MGSCRGGEACAAGRGRGTGLPRRPGGVSLCVELWSPGWGGHLQRWAHCADRPTLCGVKRSPPGPSSAPSMERGPGGERSATPENPALRGQRGPATPRALASSLLMPET